MDKRSFVLTLPFLLCSVLASAQQTAAGINFQIVNQSQIVRIGTSLNHVSVIELPEAVLKAVVGSDYIHMEYQGSTVLIEPLKNGVSTDLFVWTEHTRTTYEIQPASENGLLTYTVAENFPAPPPPPPGPTPKEAEIERDHTYGPFILTSRSIKTHHLHMDQPGLHVKLIQVAEDSHSYYVRLELVNNTGELYRVQDPSVYHVSPLFGEKMAIRSVGEQLTEKKFQQVVTYDTAQLRTHGSSLEPSDLRPNQSAEWVIAVDKPVHAPAMYMFDFPSAGHMKVRAVAVF